MYLFTTLLICDECGHNMASFYNQRWYYRCNQYSNRRTCTHSKLIRECDIEQWLFDHLGEELEKYRLDWHAKENQRRNRAAEIDRAAIRRKLKRLKELYINEVIDLDDYRRDYELYTAQLAEPLPEDEPRPNFKAIEEVVAKGFRQTYNELTREAKRTLWRSIIKEIHINCNNEITRVVFS